MSKDIELCERRAMIYLPENSIEASLEIKVYEDGDIITVQKVIPMSELRQAFSDADNNYCDPEDMFVLTERGKQIAEGLSVKFNDSDIR